MGSFNSTNPGGGSSGNRKIVSIRVRKIRSIAIKPFNAIDGCCNIRIMNQRDTSQMIAKVTGEKSIGGIASKTGSVISYPFLDSMKLKNEGKAIKIPINTMSAAIKRTGNP